MGKSIHEHDEENCPICYSDLVQSAKPKRCKHKYCYDCLTSWIKKGKKNCPMCRKSFNSILKITKRRITKRNGKSREKEIYEEIKVDQIKNQEKNKQNSSAVTPVISFINNPMVIPARFCLFVPTFPLWTAPQIPFMPWQFYPVA